MTQKQTREPQYNIIYDYDKVPLGDMVNQFWQDDPKRLAFVLARYKWVAKMLAGKKRVLEVGCADGWPSRIVASEVDSLTLSDFDPQFIADIKSRLPDGVADDAFQLDISENSSEQRYDAVYCLDVFEHIASEKEVQTLENLKACVEDKGVVIIGIPSLESQVYASEISKAGHVNCKSGAKFRELLQENFSQAFVFSMNDEIIHTGYYPMAHYLLALCVK